MRSNGIYLIAAVLTAVSLWGLGAFAQQDSSQPAVDPVAEAARKAREQQKTAPKSKHVFTNDDIPAASPAVPGTGEAKSQETTKTRTVNQAAEEKATTEEKEDTKSEKYWRKRFGRLRAQIDQAEKELDVLQRELDKDQVQYYSDPQKALMQQYNRADINERTAKVEAKKKEIEGLKQQFSDLEDQLREAGGDPGWAR